MMDVHYKFRAVKRTATKSGKCPGCGKRYRLQRTFEQTINPYNRLPDGTPKSMEDIVRELTAECIAWRDRPEYCGACRELREQMKAMGWTSDWPTFCAKVESIFGPIEGLLETAPEVYLHMVVAHGFSEYSHVLLLDYKDQVKLRAAFDEWYTAAELAPALREEGWDAFLAD
jgi:hypothetical protein